MSPNHLNRTPRKGFTLVELLVVIGIISVLIAMLLPALNKARDAAKKVSCASNMRQFGAVMRMYANDYGGWLPSSKRTQPLNSVVSPNPSGVWPDNWYYLTDVVGPLYLMMKPTMGDGGVFRCPSDEAWTIRLPLNSYYTDYGMNTFINGSGTMGALPLPSGKLSQLRLPTRTALMMETYCHSIANVYAAPPVDPATRNYNVVVRHEGMGNVLFVDGHVESRYAKEMPIQVAYPGAAAVKLVNTVFAHGMPTNPTWGQVGNF
jgi:prepilin-type N-terminal cleavage/methylation domain-containing protein/prepilin-type processing-associated H-X9-DG protein